MNHGWPLWALIIINGGAIVLTGGLLGVANLALDRRWRKGVRVQHITIAAVLTALTVVFDNFISQFLLHSHLQLGLTVLFAAGVLMGPVWGVIIGVTADLMGVLFGIVGVFSALLTFEKGLIGFTAGLVLMTSSHSHRWLVLRFYLAFMLFFALSSFGINILYFFTLGIISNVHQLWIFYDLRLIKFFPQVICYASGSLFISGFLFNAIFKNLTYPAWCQKYLTAPQQLSQPKWMKWLTR